VERKRETRYQLGGRMDSEAFKIDKIDRFGWSDAELGISNVFLCDYAHFLGNTLLSLRLLLTVYVG
jgi:hypothetical protein